MNFIYSLICGFASSVPNFTRFIDRNVSYRKKKITKKALRNPIFD